MRRLERGGSGIGRGICLIRNSLQMGSGDGSIGGMIGLE